MWEGEGEGGGCERRKVIEVVSGKEKNSGVSSGREDMGVSSGKKRNIKVGGKGGPEALRWQQEKKNVIDIY